MALLRLVLVALTCAACSSPPPGSSSPDLGVDSGQLVDSGDVGPGVDVVDPPDLAQDAGRDMVADLAAADVTIAPSDWLRFETTTGDVFFGELVATYDTARWWNPVDGPLYAVFNSSLYAPYPDDRSFRFVSANDIASMEPAVRDVPGSYRDFLRDNGIVFAQPPLAETSYVITGNDTYHLDEDGFGDFAWDIERTDDTGQRFTGLGAANTDFLVWDQPVISGVSGTVIDVVDTGVDNVPGSHPAIGTAVNNLVGIALGGSFYAYYLHFREGGLDPGIFVGERVGVGDNLGRAGNSGVSLEPHIHMVLLWYDVVADRSYSVPVEFAGIATSTTPVGPFDEVDYVVPSAETWLRAGAQTN